VRRLHAIHVGAGLWGRSWAELVAGAPGYQLVALVDAAPPARMWATETLRVPAFGTLAGALRAVPEAAVVVIASPPATHRSLAEAALSSGRHVVIEKPVALDLADARAIAAAAKASGCHAAVAQNYRFRRQTRGLAELVRGRSLGRLLGVRIACRRDLRDAWITARDWRGRMRHPFLFDMAIHHVDMLRLITGREVLEVDARSWSAPDGPFRHHPTVEALLTLEGGIPVAYEGTWAAVGVETSWNGDWELVGERARATLTQGTDDALRDVVHLGRYGSRPARLALPRLAALDRVGVLAELRRALAAGDEHETAVADNLRSFATMLALARSTEECRPVRVEEILAG